MSMQSSSFHSTSSSSNEIAVGNGPELVKGQGNSSHEFDAVTHDCRVTWLKHLQRTRAGGNRRKELSLSSASLASSSFEHLPGKLRSKSSPQLKSVDIETLPWIDDPLGEENGVGALPKSFSSQEIASLAPSNCFSKKKFEQDFGVLQGFGKRVARSIRSNDEARVGFVEGKEDANPASPRGKEFPESPIQQHGRVALRNLSRRVKSFRLGVDASPKSSNLSELRQCSQCAKLLSRLRSKEEDVDALEIQNSAQRKSIEILRDQCDTLAVEKDNLLKIQDLLCSGSAKVGSDVVELLKAGDILDILRAKDAKIVELEQQLLEKNDLQREVSILKSRVETYEELIRVKDDAIVCLTANRSSSFASPVMSVPAALAAASRSVPGDQKFVQTDMTMVDVGELARMLAAANGRAEFMNEEVVQCGALLHEAFKREENALGAAREWEAKFYQTQSKYLSLLNDIHAPPDATVSAQGGTGDQSHSSRPDVLSRLVGDVIDSQDARAKEAWTPAGAARSGLYDELGFVHEFIDYAGHPGVATVESKLRSVRDRAEDMKHELMEKDSTEWRSAWDAFLLSQDISDGNKFYPDLKYLLRRGVPLRDRCRIWPALIKTRIPEEQMFNEGGVRHYHGLLTEMWSRHKNYPIVKQIELDLTRTLPNNRHYESSRADGIPRLRRVLIAFSLHRPDIGYCQGLNRIAAVALLFMTEEEAFWALCVIVDVLMPPDYYSRHLIGAQVDQKVLKDLVYDKLPRLSAHLSEHNVDLTLFTFNWFLCIFVDNVPTRTYLRIWDTFLYEGSKVLFRYAIAALALCEKDILALKDHVSIFNYMKNIGEGLTDAQRLTEVAFNELNPFSMKLIRNLRDKHAVVVKAQLEEIEAQRREFSKPKAEIQAKVKDCIDAGNELKDDDDDD